MQSNEVLMLPMDLRQTEVVAAPVNEAGICFREILNELIDERGVSIISIHRGTGIAESTLSEYLSGKTKQPNIVHAYRLSRFFNISIDYLVFGIGSDEPYYKGFDGESA